MQRMYLFSDAELQVLATALERFNEQLRDEPDEYGAGGHYAASVLTEGVSDEIDLRS